MKPEDLDFESIMATRRKAVAKSIRKINTNDLNVLIATLFPDAAHPWRELFQQFIDENRREIFYRGDFSEGEPGEKIYVYIVYCRAKEKGIWYIPQTGVGLLEAAPLAAMKGIVDGLESSTLGT
jgi:hypothetical protein